MASAVKSEQNGGEEQHEETETVDLQNRHSRPTLEDLGDFAGNPVFL